MSAGTAGDDRPLHRRDRALVAIVPLVLLVVAALAVHRFHHQRQSSWQGIGFGMFATYDNGVSRVVRIDVEHDGEVTRADASGVLDDLVDRSRVTPLGPAPPELARRVLDRTGADRAVVEVWGIDVDAGDDVVVGLEPIRRVEAP